MYPIRWRVGERRRPVSALAVVTALALVTVIGVGPADAAAPITLPDLKIRVPINLISVGTVGGVRSLQFTHDTANLGAGPFEIDPTYNATTGIATFTQAIYTMPTAGSWVFDHAVPVSATGVWEGNGDYNFPMTSFTLNNVNPDDSINSQVAVSPKTKYCLTGDTFIGGVPNTPNVSSPAQSNCADPTKPLGWSVGWADQYDQTDPGQPIPLTGVSDGRYILRAIVDPQHVLTESDAINNVVDTLLTISGSDVTVISQTNPASALPLVTITSPTTGLVTSGTVTVTATATPVVPATITSVQFTLDGQLLGAPVTSAPYSTAWTVGGSTPGTHVLGATATDSAGAVGTAAGVSVTVPVQTGTMTIARQVSAIGKTSASVAGFSTSAAGEQLLAFVSSDGPNKSAGQTATVSGGGLTWSMVKRSNAQPGDSEVWKADAAVALSGITITSRASAGGFDQQLGVVAIQGAGGVGASVTNGAPTGASTISYLSTATGSLGFVVGNDYDQAMARTLGVGQVMVAQYPDSATGDTFWLQSTASVSTGVGQTITLNDTAPTTDHWNMAGVEVVPSGTPPPPMDTTPPTVNVTNPLAGMMLSGTVPVAASASDNVAVAGVQFVVDGQPVGAPVAAPPYAIQWDTTTVTSGSHAVSARATDTSENTATSVANTITVSNPPPPPPACFIMDAHVVVHGRGTVTTSNFHTGVANEVLVALVSSDGPKTSGGQTATVSGAGLNWTRTARSNKQYGDAEIWTATAPITLSNVTVKSTPGKSGYDQQLTVIAMQGSHGVRANAIASGGTGAPTVRLTTVTPTSLVYMVGNDWDGAVARTLPPGQVLLDQWLDTGTGDTFWNQQTNQPTGAAGSMVTMNDTAPTNHQWNAAAVELINDDN